MNGALADVIERGYREIEAQPEYLLETTGGPVGMKADVYVARLYGLDGQVDREVRLSEALPSVLIAVPQRVTTMADEGPSTTHSPAIPLVRYDLQSNYALMPLDRRWAPEAPHDPVTHLVRVLCLRYKREPIAR